MWAYLKRHERFLRLILGADLDRSTLLRLRREHARQLAYMQHERLIHLLVTLAVCTFLLLVLGYALVHPMWPSFVMSALLLILVAGYIIHYFRLENGVQRWYELANDIDARIFGSLEELSKGASPN